MPNLWLGDCISATNMAGSMLSLLAIFRSPGGVAHWESNLPLWEALAAELPQVSFATGSLAGELPSLVLEMENWESQSFNFYELDGQLDALAESQAGSFGIILLGSTEELARSALGVLTRCQRWMDRRNEASRIPLFDRVLAAHRQAHDLAKPLVRADYNHALDTWQWLLRLAPDSGLAEQLAALFHDVERLISETDARVEHRAPDYQGFKDAHAARGAELAEALLAAAGCDEETRRETARLIAVHERTPAGEEQDAEAISRLNDADALSFFSLNSVGYLDYYGPEATRRKVAFTLRRLRPAARRVLAGIRLPEIVSEMLAGEPAERAA
jgi:Domain of unknown function (DUF4202)